MLPSYLGSVEDGRDRQHGDDEQDLGAAAHVTRHDEHLGESWVQGELHHQPPRGREPT